MTSLEEVFLEIAKQAEVAAAQAKGNVFRTGFLRDGTQVQVPIGADFVDLPSGGRFQVRWAQDENGELVVMDLQPMAPPAGSAYNRGPGGPAAAPSQRP